jgi:hypothetical protein
MQSHRMRVEGRITVNELFLGLVLISTISLAMAFGVVSGYLIITGILNAFARKQEGGKPTAALTPQGVTGD